MRKKRKLQVYEGKTLNGEERTRTLSIGGSIRTGMCKPWTRTGAESGLATGLASHAYISLGSHHLGWLRPHGSHDSSGACLCFVAFFVNIQNAVTVTGPALYHRSET